MSKKAKIVLIVIGVVIFVEVIAVTALITRRVTLKQMGEPESGQSEEPAQTGKEDTGENTGQSAKKTEESVDLSTVPHSSKLDTGNLTETGNGYEGKKGTGDFNYGEALQKSILFYELQRSGDLPEKVRCNWRGDSGLLDGQMEGVDLTGGWYDAGDHVKFNLPMAYTGAVLGWSVYEDRASYEESGQLSYMLDDLRWVNDYLIKCHTKDHEFYYQVGDGGSDHSWWGPAEVLPMDRPAYKVTDDQPGSAVVAEAAASLAVASIVFEKEDKEYSKTCLTHAKSLYEFADSTRSDAGYTAADGFYNSWSGYYDELAWAGAWLYLATDDKAYLKNAESCFKEAGHDYDWAMCWDDVHIGAAVLLAKITEKDEYKSEVEQHLDYWSTGTASGERITYTPKGLAWLDSWGSLRYATTTAFVASVYADWDGCPKKKAQSYTDFAVSQANYALGSTGFSYQIGFGDSYPVHPHHRTTQGSYCDNMNEPAEARHTLYGALVGGPDASDGYTDEVSNYNTNEVACDYNAGFTGLLAKLYGKYHGQTLKDFGAVEPILIDEYEVEAGINASGADFTEIKAVVMNKTAWPARAADEVELRYFVDLSEVYASGGSVEDIEITTNYMQSGEVAGLKPYDEGAHIYYLSVLFNDGNLYPGGQEHFKQEIQVRMASKNGAWDPSNDPSYKDLSGAQGTVGKVSGMALFEDGELVFGSEP